jgi:V8-like Glu-specific endopeptidase
MQRHNKQISLILAVAFLIALNPLPAVCQPAPIPSHTEPYYLDSSVHDGVSAETYVAFDREIRVPDAPWLRLKFSDYDLGQRSFVRIVSVEDGGSQRLDAESLGQWRSSTAVFNGNAILIELHVSPGDRGVYFVIEDVIVGEWVGGEPVIKSICNNDDRVSSTDDRVGRIRPVGCTGWIVSNGANLTAGHCTDGTGNFMQIFEFDVPPSLCDGTTVAAHPDDQYPVDATSIVFAVDGGGIGDDWAVFDCLQNANTGLLAVHARAGFYRMTHDMLPSTARVTGYGVDDDPACDPGECPTCIDGRNDDSQTQQTNSGVFLNEDVQGPSDVVIEYIVDTTGGSSGSPVVMNGTTTTIGIHTNAGCSPPTGGNHGTGFENNSLEQAIQVFPGLNFVYVDGLHLAAFTDGTVFRPYRTVALGVSAAPSNATLGIVAGSYDEALTISKPLTLVAPVGSVTIGQ